MSEWSVGLLSDIAQIAMGQSPKGDTCNSNGDGIPLLNGPTEFGIRHPSPVQYTTDGKRFSRKGDILFCVRGSTTGKMNWSDQKYAIGRGVAAVRHLKGDDFSYFVKGVLDFQLPLLLASATGSTFPNVSKEQLNNLEIDIPPLPEQRAIAGVLSALDDKIDLLQRQNRTLESLAQALFRHWFIDGAVHFVKLPNLVEINPSLSLRKGTSAQYLEMRNVQTDSCMPIDWYEREYNSGTRFQNGDTLMARITPCLENDKVAFVNFLRDGEVGWGSTEFLVLRARRNLPAFYTYLLAKNSNFRAFAIKTMTGSSGRQRVQTASLYDYELGYPSAEDIHIFTQQIAVIEPKLRHNAAQIRTLAALRDTLLPKLMSGEVRVRG